MQIATNITEQKNKDWIVQRVLNHIEEREYPLCVLNKNEIKERHKDRHIGRQTEEEKEGKICVCVCLM